MTCRSVDMSIVFPRKNCKDIFAPRKSIQEAKEKLGPAYFDPSLLGCSRNAVELTKLVNAWEEIEKERSKLLKTIDREQQRLKRSLKRNLIHSESDESKTNLHPSEEGLETQEGKAVPPGFRFKANGELKHASKMTLPLVDQEDEEDAVAGPSSGCSCCRARDNGTEDETLRNVYGSIDYRKEVEDLELILDSIVFELARNNIRLSKSKLKHTFLRGRHSSEYISLQELIKHQEQTSPNDRFAFKPGTSSREELHKRRVTTPSHRNCIGCLFKLKQESDDLARIRKTRESKNVLKKQWSYTPHGKYVQSSTMLRSSISLATDTPSLRSKPSENLIRRKTVSDIVTPTVCGNGYHRQSAKPFVVEFKTEAHNKDDKVKRMSAPSSVLKSDVRIKSSPDVTRARSALEPTRSLSSARKDFGATISLSRGLDSAQSSVWRLGSTRTSSQMLQACVSRRNALKAFQVYFKN